MNDASHFILMSSPLTSDNMASIYTIAVGRAALAVRWI